MKVKQDKILKRLVLCLPIFAISIGLMFIDFNVIWRYFAWTNQTLSVFTLWTISVWLGKRGKNYWVSLIPAYFMTIVCTTYILMAPEGFNGSQLPSVTTGICLASVCLGIFQKKAARWKKEA